MAGAWRTAAAVACLHLLAVSSAQEVAVSFPEAALARDTFASPAPAEPTDIALEATAVKQPEKCAGLETTQSAYAQITSELSNQLKGGRFQWFNGLFALVFGLVMLFDGEFVFMKLVVIAVGVFCYELAMAELTGTWASWSGPGSATYSQVIEKIIAVEVGLAAAAVTYVGFNGVRVLIGMLLGGFLAHCCYVHLGSLRDNSWVVFLLANFWVLIMTKLFTGKMHRRVAAIVCSILGGALVTSAMAFFLTLLCVKTGWLTEQLSITYKATPPWVEFLFMLTHPNKGFDRGIFTNSTLNVPVSGDVVPLDFALGTAFWAVLTIIGFIVQRKYEKKAYEAAAAAAAAAAPPADAGAAAAGSRKWYKPWGAKPAAGATLPLLEPSR